MMPGIAFGNFCRALSVAALGAVALPHAAAQPIPIPATPREFRGVWIATVGGVDWPVRTQTPAQQQAALIQAFDRAAQNRMNAVVFQLRPGGDALYPSSLEPWSHWLTNQEGRAPSPLWDPLQFAIDQARARGMELHAWFNPYRAKRGSYTNAASHISNTNPELVYNYGADLWMDPARIEVQNRSAAVINDVVTRYDVDAVHMDDYFYPYAVNYDVTSITQVGGVATVTTSGAHTLRTGYRVTITRASPSGYNVSNATVTRLSSTTFTYAVSAALITPATVTTNTDVAVLFPDHNTYANYLSGGGNLSLANWRRDSVNRFVQRINNETHSTKPWVRFGISPFGIWRPGFPPGITGLDAYATLYADSRLWLQSGWVDYFSPQLYWRPNQVGQQYALLLDWWISQNTRGRHIWPGLFTSQIEASAWPVQDILDEVTLTQQRPGSTGNIHFSERAFRSSYNDQAPTLNAALQSGAYRQEALVPASPWLDNVPPAAPAVNFMKAPTGQVTLSWTATGSEAARVWVVHYLVGSTWTHDIVPGTTTSLVLPGTGNSAPTWGAVTAVDRTGNESTRTVRELAVGAPEGFTVY